LTFPPSPPPDSTSACACVQFIVLVGLKGERSS
jgi:hypothetical protein